jgi:hypothetical protein
MRSEQQATGDEQGSTLHAAACSATHFTLVGSDRTCKVKNTKIKNKKPVEPRKLGAKHFQRA